MSAPYGSDEYWKKHLTPEQYAVMRGGMVEPPGTGAYLTNTRHGSYHCAACNARLFSTGDMLLGARSYVSCAAPVSDQMVKTEERYTHTGGQYTAVLCAQCGSVVGRLDDTELQSAHHLETGERHRSYELYSTALVFRRALTARNFPVLYLLAAIFTACTVAGGYYLYNQIHEVTSYQNMPHEVRLWLVDGEITVRTIVAHGMPVEVRRDSFASSSAVLVAFTDTTSRSLSIRGLPHSSVLVWLDTDFKVVAVEKLDHAIRTHEQSPQVTLALILLEPYANRASALQVGSEVLRLERAKVCSTECC